MLSTHPFVQDQLQTVHFIGIGGIGMSGIAEILHNMGYAVQGSDNASSYITERLQAEGIKVMFGHQPENLGAATLVVKSTAVRPTNPEIIEAERRGIPIVHRAEMLAEIMRGKLAIAIAGSHGKTTTTSLMAVTREGGLDATIMNGGVIAEFKSNAYLGTSDVVVVEADESDGSFLKLPRTIAVVTNIDREHMDHYGNFADLLQAFHDFITGIPFYGFAVLCADHDLTAKLASDITTRTIYTYGIDKPADVMASNIRVNGQGSEFTVTFSPRFAEIAGAQSLQFALAAPGQHNVLNSLAVITIGLRLQIATAQINKALAEFAGVKRRFTCTGEEAGIRVIDDYAHHPKEIEVTLQAARTVADARGGRVLAVFQPHRYTRVHDLMAEFAACFASADQVWITDIYSAGEDPIAGVSTPELIQKMHQEFADRLPKSGAEYLPSLEQMAAVIKEHAKAGDLVLCMGAGDITKYAYALPQKLAGA